MKKIEDIRIEIEKEITISGELWYARKQKSQGLAVFVHGFGGNRHENGLFNEIATKLVERGFDALLYDWRGIGGSGGDYHSTNLGRHVEDFQKVISWARGNINCPMYAIGFSLGASVIGLSLEQSKVEFDRIAYLSPAVRPGKSMWARYEKSDLWDDIRKYGFANKPGSDIRIGKEILFSLRDTDLGSSAFNIPIPLLVCHGTSDDRICCSHTRELVSARERISRDLQKSSDQDFCYLEVPGASHSFRPTDVHWSRLAAKVSEWFSGHRPQWYSTDNEGHPVDAAA
jgi:alpha-beta hydrolase superfamily lysophospholipase